MEENASKWVSAVASWICLVYTVIVQNGEKRNASATAVSSQTFSFPVTEKEAHEMLSDYLRGPKF